MNKKWDYRHELINFQRHDDGSVSYQTMSQGKIPYQPFESSKLLLEVSQTARDLAEKTLKDVVVYVREDKIIFRIRTVCSSSFY